MPLGARSVPGYIMKIDSCPEADQIKVLFLHTLEVSEENKQIGFIKPVENMNCSISWCK